MTRRVSLRVPDDLWVAAQQVASEERRSVSQVLVCAIEDGLPERSEPISREEMTKLLRASNQIRSQMLQSVPGTHSPVSDVVAGLAGLHPKIGTAGDLVDGLNSPGVTSEPVGWEP